MTLPLLSIPAICLTGSDPCSRLQVFCSDASQDCFFSPFYRRYRSGAGRNPYRSPLIFVPNLATEACFYWPEHCVVDPVLRRDDNRNQNKNRCFSAGVSENHYPYSELSCATAQAMTLILTGVNGQRICASAGVSFKGDWHDNPTRIMDKCYFILSISKNKGCPPSDFLSF